MFFALIQFVFSGKYTKLKDNQLGLRRNRYFFNARAKCQIHTSQTVVKTFAMIAQDFFIGRSYQTWFLVSIIFSLWYLLGSFHE